MLYEVITPEFPANLVLNQTAHIIPKVLFTTHRFSKSWINTPDYESTFALSIAGDLSNSQTSLRFFSFTILQIDYF